jgi:hypothetical protein
VIGGLSVATFSTLLFVPIMFSLFRRNSKPDKKSQKKMMHPKRDEAQ